MFLFGICSTREKDSFMFAWKESEPKVPKTETLIQKGGSFWQILRENLDRIFLLNFVSNESSFSSCSSINTVNDKKKKDKEEVKGWRAVQAELTAEMNHMERKRVSRRP